MTQTDKVKSIDEVIREAFHYIQDNHGVVLDSISIHSEIVSFADGEHYHCQSIAISAQTK